MISVTEEAEKRLHALLKGKKPANLRVVYGPDQRLRLVLDEGSKKTGNGEEVSVRGETSFLLDNTVIDVRGQEIVFNNVTRHN